MRHWRPKGRGREAVLRTRACEGGEGSCIGGAVTCCYSLSGSDRLFWVSALFVCVCLCVSVCLFVCLCICNGGQRTFICMSVWLFECMYVCVFVWFGLFMSVCPSVCLSVCIFITFSHPLHLLLLLPLSSSLPPSTRRPSKALRSAWRVP